MAKRDNLDIWFEDECHFQQHGSRCTMWVPPEDIYPVVLHAPTRKNAGVVGAVSAKSGRLVVRREQRFNAETFLSLRNCFITEETTKKWSLFLITHNGTTLSLSDHG
jgi:hypothetical protein